MHLFPIITFCSAVIVLGIVAYLQWRTTAYSDLEKVAPTSVPQRLDVTGIPSGNHAGEQSSTEVKSQQLLNELGHNSYFLSDVEKAVADILELRKSADNADERSLKLAESEIVSNIRSKVRSWTPLGPALGRHDVPELERQQTAPLFVHLGMQVVVSVAFLGAALYILLSGHFDEKDKHWAYGTAGTLLGFWLKH